MIAAAMLLVAAASPDPVAGIWVGTSLCQLRPSACHDEQVVYHLTATGHGRYLFDAKKIVGGQELDMGTLDNATFDQNSGRLTATSTDRQGGVAHWGFIVRGKHMSGRLLNPDGRLFRLIEVDKR
jgi:hypothetical protein